MKVEVAIQMDSKQKKGELNNKWFKDTQFMNLREQEALIDFIDKVIHHQKLNGKNKPSWQNDFGNEIPNTTLYKQLNCWHYHSGPNYRRKKNIVDTIDLAFNPNGDTSAEVIHYQKKGQDVIFIQAFSPQHEPFPDIQIMPNPILQRKYQTIEQKMDAIDAIINEIEESD